MILGSIVGGGQSQKNDSNPPKDTGADKAQQDQQKAPAAQEPTKTQNAQAAAATQSTSKASTAAKAAAAPSKLTTAEDEVFARAAAQRNVDSARTRALIDTISPVNNSSLQAAKSYLTAVEPKAPEAESKSLAPAKQEPLNKAA